MTGYTGISCALMYKVHEPTKDDYLKMARFIQYFCAVVNLPLLLDGMILGLCYGVSMLHLPFITT